MDRLEFGYSEETTTKQSRSRGKKRKWREIENLKEKNKLKKELEELDFSGHFLADEIDF